MPMIYVSMNTIRSETSLLETSSTSIYPESSSSEAQTHTLPDLLILIHLPSFNMTAL